jgi:hypothetical protein
MAINKEEEKMNIINILKNASKSIIAILQPILIITPILIPTIMIAYLYYKVI